MRRRLVGGLCVLLVFCVWGVVAEGGGKKKKSLLVLPVDYVEGATRSAKASEAFTDDLRDVVEKQGTYRLLSPTLGFQRLAGVSGNPSSLGRLLGGGEKPDKVVYVKVTKVGKRYILRGALYRQIGGEWSVERKKKLVRKGKESDVSVWLGEIYDALFLPDAGQRKTFTAGGVAFAVRWIPKGSFVMGSPPDEKGRFDHEGPQRSVQISKGFWMLETEVTQGQYKALMGSNPSSFQKCGENCPVEKVSWNEARVFANKLSEAEKLAPCTETDRGIFQCKGWRLPTEAEWEYAARAGTTTATHNTNSTYGIVGQKNAPNLDGIAWYGGNSGVTYEGGLDCSDWEEKQYENKVCGTQPVGGKSANGWGLKDMLGNVWEWTMDVYGPYAGLGTQDPLRSSGSSERVYRGGGWSSDAGFVRSAFRFSIAPTLRSFDLGFRLLRY